MGYYGSQPKYLTVSGEDLHYLSCWRRRISKYGSVWNEGRRRVMCNPNVCSRQVSV